MRTVKAFMIGLFLSSIILAETKTAVDFSCSDVNGKSYRLFELLDAGKVVITHFITAS